MSPTSKKVVRRSNRKFYYAYCHDDVAINESATIETTAALKECARQIEAIHARYPGVGIGDTATDECIANTLYNLIH